MYNKIGLQGRLVSDPRWKRVIQDGEPTEIVEFLLSVERDEPVDSWGFRKHRLTRAHREKQLKMSCQALHNAPPNRT